MPERAHRRGSLRYFGGSVGLAGWGCVGVGDGRGCVAVGSGVLPSGTVPEGAGGELDPAGGTTGPCTADAGASCCGAGVGSEMPFCSDAFTGCGTCGSCARRACAS